MKTELLNNKYHQSHVADYGTFKDSLRAPVHRWFKYPAGYSYRLVEEKISRYCLNEKHWILDPFVGCGTTSIEAKRYGINSIGIEAHPFVHWVAKTKINWKLNISEIESYYYRILKRARIISRKVDLNGLPELVRKCYSHSNLKSLIAIRDSIRFETDSENIRNFLNLALTDTLRNASKAATGWPYISPAKIHEKINEKDAFSEFQAQVHRMVEDLVLIKKESWLCDADCLLILGDARDRHEIIKNESVDIAITSPPYLNNYDYADRTRLETYFFGWYKSWGEITRNVRNQLIISATTQVQRGKFEKEGILSEDIYRVDQELFNELLTKIKTLSQHRKQKAGKKSYDFMVAGYFNHMLQVFSQVYRVLKPNSDFVLVLGDSAPYGVYIPTHEYLARLATAIGFSAWDVEFLRKRGDKWKANPQRHKVKLKEVILTLSK